MNIDSKTASVGSIVRKDYRAARIFKDHSIDFCCGGEKTLEQACQENNLDSNSLIKEIHEAFTHPADSAPNFDHWPLDLLVDYIEKKHHRYVESNISIVKHYLNTIAEVHGQTAPYLHVILEVFEKSAGNLTQHIKKEELVLFPYMRKMVQAHMRGESFSSTKYSSVQNPTEVMEQEHTAEGENFREIAELSNNYEIPEWGCNTYAVAMQLLKEFQDDLHLHIHLENNILFPKAISLEQSFHQTRNTSISQKLTKDRTQ